MSREWPLVAFTVCGPGSVGVVYATLIMSLGDHPAGMATNGVLLALVLALVGIAGSILHLEKPLRAYRAIRGFPHSPLSREVVVSGVYLAALGALFGSLLAGFPVWTGWVVLALGLFATISSAQVYLLPSRPEWNRWTTVVRFLSGGVALGGALALTLPLGRADEASQWAEYTVGSTVLSAIVVAAIAAAAGSSTDGHRQIRLIFGTLTPAIAIVASFIYDPLILIALAGTLGREIADRRLFFRSATGLPPMETAGYQDRPRRGRSGAPDTLGEAG